MRRLPMTLLPLLLVACGPDYKDPRSHAETNPVFKSYVDAFQDSADADVSHIPINFGDIDEDKAGICIRYKGGEAEIIINEEYWGSSTNADQRYDLIFHELGHCYLGRDHNMVLLDDDCPGSFMNDTVINRYCLEEHWDELMDEMF